MCQPGKPRPQGLSHSIWRRGPSSVESFQSAKSAALRFSLAPSMRSLVSCAARSMRASSP